MMYYDHDEQPAVKGRMSLEAIATDPEPRRRETMQPVKAPTAVSSCSMIACKTLSTFNLSFAFAIIPFGGRRQIE